MENQLIKDIRNKAISMAESENFPEAIKLYKRAILLEPNDATIHEELAQCQLEEGQWKEAYDSARRATIMSPDWPEAHKTYGRCARSHGLLNDAVLAFSKVKELTGEDQELKEIEKLIEKEISLKIKCPNIRIKQNFDKGLGPGSIVWNCGLLLSSTLLHTNLIKLKNKKVLELGSGTGICGIVSAMLGAKVYLTDKLSILKLIEENVKCNDEYIKKNNGECHIKELMWNNLNSEILKEKFDIIIGSDLVYTKNQATDLFNILNQCLKHNPEIKIIMSHKSRNTEIDDFLIKKLKIIGIHLKNDKFDKNTFIFQLNDNIKIYMN